MIVSKYFAGGGLWRLLNINLFITSARPLKSIFSLLTVEVYKIAKMYIEYVVYSPFLALSG
jgi:hypothetical protein